MSINNTFVHTVYAALFSFLSRANLRCLSVNEAVNSIPPLSLSLSGQETKKREGKAARFIQLLLVHTTADLHSLLELTMATKHHSIQENLDCNKKDTRYAKILGGKNRECHSV